MKSDTPKYIGDLLDRYAVGEREFPNCDFESHDNLQSMIFDNSNLQGSTFFSADFTGTSFKNCNLKNCSFECCKFEQVNFENANLSESLLSGAEFIKCNFKNAKFDNADYYGHKLTTEDFLIRINKEKPNS